MTETTAAETIPYVRTNMKISSTTTMPGESTGSGSTTTFPDPEDASLSTSPESLPAYSIDDDNENEWN